MFSDKLTAVIDYRSDNEIIENLKKLNINVVTTRKHEFLDEPVNGHPDMVIFQENFSEIIVCPEEYDYYIEKLKFLDIRITKGEKVLTKKYPKNICYNAVVNGKNFFHKLDSTDKKILDSMNEKKIKMINVNQGYTKCSIVNMGKKGIITSDRTIWKAFKEEGMEALLISNGHIKLSGYDYGFIGGATGFVDNTLFLTGIINNHPDYSRMINFLKERSIKIVFLSKKNVYDLGTIIFIKTRKF